MLFLQIWSLEQNFSSERINLNNEDEPDEIKSNIVKAIETWCESNKVKNEKFEILHKRILVVVSNDEETDGEEGKVADEGDFEGVDSDTEILLLEINMFFLKCFKVVCTFSST